MRLGRGALRDIQKNGELLSITPERRRELEKDGPEMRPERQRVLDECRRGLLDLDETFDVRDEATRFEGKEKGIWSLRRPLLIGAGPRQMIERIVHFGARELAGIELQIVAAGGIARIKNALPNGIGPARRTQPHPPPDLTSPRFSPVQLKAVSGCGATFP